MLTKTTTPSTEDQHAVRRYVFRATTQPRPKELHCLWATLTDKALEQDPLAEYRVHSNGRLVTITTSMPIAPSTVELERVTFEFLRAEAHQAWTYQTGDHVVLEGVMSYSVNKKATTGKTLCPVDPLGRVVPELRKHFFQYLEAQTGLDMSPQALQDSTFLVDDLSDAGVDKVWLNDVITFSIRSTVKDAARFNRMAHAAIGRRKAYGFGIVVVTQHAPAFEPCTEIAEETVAA